MEKLKVLDLFAGIGGFTLGLDKTGLYETVAFCEWDKQAQQVLKKHWPETHVFGDIKSLVGCEGYASEVYYKSGARDGLYDLSLSRKVEILTGGFPCQDISNCGSKRGLEGERSGLWTHYLRLISEIKPKGVIIENVSALRTRGLGTVLQNLNEVGYDAEWHCIPASFTGAPHKRDRIFILAYPYSIGLKEPWRPLQSIRSTPEVYREASGIVDAFQRQSLPYVCGRHDGVSKSVDRLKQLGNAVAPAIIEQLGYHLHSNLVRMGLVKPTTQ